MNKHKAEFVSMQYNLSYYYFSIPGSEKATTSVSR